MAGVYYGSIDTKKFTEIEIAESDMIEIEAFFDIQNIYKLLKEGVREISVEFESKKLK